MKAYSLDLRQKVVQAHVHKRGTQEELAAVFGVSRAFVQRLLRRQRTTGSIAPLPHGGGSRPLLTEEARVVLRQRVQQQPDSTLAELCAVLAAETGIRVSVPTLCTTLQRLGLGRKKSLSTPPNRTARASRRPARRSLRA